MIVELQSDIKIDSDYELVVSDEVFEKEKHFLRVCSNLESGSINFDFSSRLTMYDFAKHLLYKLIYVDNDFFEFVPVEQNGVLHFWNGIRLALDSSRLFVSFSIDHEKTLSSAFVLSANYEELDFIENKLSDQHYLKSNLDKANGDVYLDFSSQLAMYDFAKYLLYQAVYGKDGYFEFFPSEKDGELQLINGVRMTLDSPKIVVKFPEK